VRIAIVAPPWVPVPPPAYGGTEAVLDPLARGLQDAGHEVMLFTTGDSLCPVPKSWIFDHAVGVGSGGVATELRHVIHAYAAAAEFDVVHDHTLTGPLYAQRFPWLPVVTTNHGPFESDLGDIYRALGPRAQVIAISAHQASTAAGVHIAAIIHHGVDPSAFTVGPGGDYALFLGRMSPDKGVHTAVRVAREAGVRLVIAAKMREPAERAYFEARVEPLLGPTVEYVGEVGGAAKLDLLANARCLLNPIAWPEPFGMVMIESLACGTPVIATPCGATREIVQDGVTGFIRPDQASLAVALGQVGNLDRRQCRKAVEGHFSAARMVAEHVSFYRKAIAETDEPMLRLVGSPA
jgi:glycosyltransferase involved in cell wall biosynthesis